MFSTTIVLYFIFKNWVEIIYLGNTPTGIQDSILKVKESIRQNNEFDSILNVKTNEQKEDGFEKEEKEKFI